MLPQQDALGLNREQRALLGSVHDAGACNTAGNTGLFRLGMPMGLLFGYHFVQHLCAALAVIWVVVMEEGARLKRVQSSTRSTYISQAGWDDHDQDHNQQEGCGTTETLTLSRNVGLLHRRRAAGPGVLIWHARRRGCGPDAARGPDHKVGAYTGCALVLCFSFQVFMVWDYWIYWILGLRVVICLYVCVPASD